MNRGHEKRGNSTSGHDCRL